MGAQHTPGPWSAHNSDAHPTADDDGKRFWTVCAGDVYKSPSDNHVSGYIACPEQHVAMAQSRNSEADARLIAAAPDMLAALENLVNSFEKPRPKAYWDAARAAIAKARGEAA